MTNCLTARAVLLANPAAHDPDLWAHLALCPGCRGFATSISHDEALLRGAIDVPVPAQLQERILLQTQLQRGCPFSAIGLRIWTAVKNAPYRAGAGAVVAAVMAIVIWMSQPADAARPNWGEVSLAHAIGEPSAVQSTQSLPPAALSAALASYGLVLKGDLGDIRFVEHCPVPGGRGIHAVIDTRQFGKVTLIFPPFSRKHGGFGAASGEGLSAQVFNIGGVSVGLVTNDAGNLSALAGLLTEHIASQAS